MLAIASCAAPILAAAAPANDGDLLLTRTWATHYVHAKDFKRAEAKVAALLKRHPDDPRLWMLMGDVEKYARKYKKSVLAYANAVAHSEGQEQAESLYHYAYAQALNGDRKGALRTFTAFGSKPEYAELSQRAVRSLEHGFAPPPFTLPKIEPTAEAQQAPAQRAWSASATLTTGYDSNVSLLPDESKGPASFFVTPSAQGRYVGQLARSDFQGLLTLGYTHNFKAAAHSSDNLPASLSFDWLLPGALGARHRLSLNHDTSLTFARVTSGLSLYSVADTLSLKKKVAVAAGTLHLSLPLGYTGYPGVNSFGANVRDGFNAGLAAAHEHRLGAIPLSQTLSYKHQFARGDNYVTNAFALALWAEPLKWRELSLSVNGGFTRTFHPQSSASRADSKWDAGAQVSKSLQAWAPLSASLGYSFGKNNSNVPSASYQKDVYSLKVTYAP